MLTKDEVVTGVPLEENQFYLPIGIEGDSGQICRIVTLRPADGDTEEAMGDSKIKNNSGKVITEMLFSIIESIDGIKKVTKDHIRNMSSIDRDYLMIMGYAVSFKYVLDFVHTCPTKDCGTENVTHIPIKEMPVTFLEDSAERTLTFTLPKGIKDAQGNVYSTITVRYPNGADVEIIGPIVKLNPGKANTALIQRVTVSVLGDQGTYEPLNDSVFKRMLQADRDTVNQTIRDNSPGVDTEVTYVCSGCGEKITTKIPAARFLSL